MEFARFVSVIFLMFQALLILVLAYTLNDTLVTNVEKEEAQGKNPFLSCSGIILIVIFLCITTGDITWLVYEFKEFTGDDCGSNMAWLIISAIMGFFTFGIVLFRTRQDASVLTSAIVWLYQMYLQWSAMASNPDAECNPYFDSAVNTTMMIVTGLFFTFLSLLILGASKTKEDDATVTGGMAAPLMEKPTEEKKGGEYESVLEDGKGAHGNKVKEGEGKDGKKKKEDDEHVFPISTATIIFQALMMLASIYFSMLMTNWGNPTVMDNNHNFFSHNDWSYWVQMTAVWLSQIIYTFSLTAPVCFPGREFK